MSARSQQASISHQQQQQLSKSRLPSTSKWTNVRLLILVGASVVACWLQAQPASAILNCFPQKMFNKLGKGGQQVPYPGGGGGGPERANWYPQQTPPQLYNQYPTSQFYGMQYPGGMMNMKSLLFQPKWKSGSLLGTRGGWGSIGWKMPGASSPGFYRPGFGYNYAGYGAGGLGSNLFGGSMLPTGYAGAGVGPELLANYPSGGGGGGGYSPVLNSYTTGSGSSNPNDGWTVPSQQQIGLGGYESGFAQPPQQQQQPIRQPSIDPYGSIKGSSRPTSSTKKGGNILLADGGYNAFDAHYLDPSAPFIRNRTFGYSYPESYSGVVDSPAKIAQQLMKYGLRQQRLQQQQHYSGRLAPLILLASNGSNISSTGGLGPPSRLILMDEPKFVGFGVIDVLNTREARLSCSFNEPIDLAASQPVWIKFLGNYNSTQMSGANIVPPFNCPSTIGQCRTQEIEPLKEARYRFDHGPATSTLIISEPRVSDYGVYRCSALSKVSSTNNNNIIYKIVNLGDSV